MDYITCNLLYIYIYFLGENNFFFELYFHGYFDLNFFYFINGSLVSLCWKQLTCYWFFFLFLLNIMHVCYIFLSFFLCCSFYLFLKFIIHTNELKKKTGIEITFIEHTMSHTMSNTFLCFFYLCTHFRKMFNNFGKFNTKRHFMFSFIQKHKF